MQGLLDAEVGETFGQAPKNLREARVRRFEVSDHRGNLPTKGFFSDPLVSRVRPFECLPNFLYGS